MRGNAQRKANHIKQQQQKTKRKKIKQTKLDENAQNWRQNISKEAQQKKTNRRKL